MRVTRGMIIFIVIALALATAITAGVIALVDSIQRARQAAVPAGCEVETPRGAQELEVEQARVAATIAAVADQRRMPKRAVVIAYATALQESKLFNLDHGDRDSVGVFQQRPSMGWGPEKKLRDPVYASRRFFDALADVPNYRKKPIDRAAQAVQRSADGYAYAQHEELARILADAFTGDVPKAVRCWPSGKSILNPKPAKKTTTDARREFARAQSGDSSRSSTRKDGAIRVDSSRRGWAAASWAVAHSAKYGIRSVQYDGARWTHDKGWTGEAADDATEITLK